MATATNPYSTLTEPGAAKLWDDMQADLATCAPGDRRDLREFYQGEIDALFRGFDASYDYGGEL